MNFFSALGEECSDDPAMDFCSLSDLNSHCDAGNTDTCICSAGFVEELTVCQGGYKGQLIKL